MLIDGVNVDDKVRLDLSPVVCPSCRFASAPCRIVLNPWNSRIDNQIVFRLLVFCEFCHHDDYNWVWIMMILWLWWLWVEIETWKRSHPKCWPSLTEQQLATLSLIILMCWQCFYDFNMLTMILCADNDFMTLICWQWFYMLTMILICWQWEVATWQRQWRHCHTHGQRVHLKAPPCLFVCKDPHNCHNCHHNSRHNDDQPHLACFPSMASRVW